MNWKNDRKAERQARHNAEFEAAQQRERDESNQHRTDLQSHCYGHHRVCEALEAQGIDPVELLIWIQTAPTQ